MCLLKGVNLKNDIGRQKPCELLDKVSDYRYECLVLDLTLPDGINHPA